MERRSSRPPTEDAKSGGMGKLEGGSAAAVMIQQVVVDEDTQKKRKGRYCGTVPAPQNCAIIMKNSLQSTPPITIAVSNFSAALVWVDFAYHVPGTKYLVYVFSRDGRHR